MRLELKFKYIWKPGGNSSSLAVRWQGSGQAGSSIPWLSAKSFPSESPDLRVWFLKLLFQHCNAERRGLRNRVGKLTLCWDEIQMPWRGICQVHLLGQMPISLFWHQLCPSHLGHPALEMKRGPSLILTVLSLRDLIHSEIKPAFQIWGSKITVFNDHSIHHASHNNWHLLNPYSFFSS
jgi:hypothetical protein